MRFVAIICEFNPLHNGHSLLIKKAKELSNTDAVICIMSGNFVQRAEPAICDTYSRATMAILAGADCVIELPTLYATACGERFSEGAINIANSIKDITHLAFGTESGDISFLSDIAKVQVAETQEFKQILKDNLDSGVSYPKALSLATKEILGLNSEINLPNDLLGIEYIKQLLKTNSNIAPLTISRVGCNHHDTKFLGEFSSASSVRNLIANKEWIKIKQTMPKKTFDILKKEHREFAVDYNLFNKLVVVNLRTKDIYTCPDNNEGLDKKLKAASSQNVCLNTILDIAKSKRYTMARIKRLCLQSMLDITRYPNIYDFNLSAKLIAINKKLKSAILPLLPNNIIIKNSDEQKYLSTQKKPTQKDLQYIEKINQTANSIYSLLQNKNGKCNKALPLLER